MRDDELYYERSLSSNMTPVVMWLIIANVAAFAVQVIFHLAAPQLNLLHGFGLNPKQVASLHLWQFATYMFLHSVGNPLHIFFNMLTLYFFGRDIELTLGRLRFIAFYAVAGAIGGLAYVAIQLARGVDLPLIGASGAVMGVLVLYACYFPERIVLLILFPIKVKWLVLIVFGMDLVVALNVGGVGSVAHLGGAAFGFAFARLGPAIERWLERRRAARESLETESEIDEERMLDEILDKVHAHGLGALTRREKKFLQQMSRKISHKS